MDDEPAVGAAVTDVYAGRGTRGAEPSRTSRGGVAGWVRWPAPRALRPALVTSLMLLAACAGQNVERIRESDLREAMAALEANIAAIQSRDTEFYLSQYLDSPDLAIVDADTLRRGYVFFAEARRASDEWPDTLIAHGRMVTWIAPGVVWAAFPFTAVQDGATVRGMSERLFVKTAGGWKIAVTGSMPQCDC